MNALLTLAALAGVVWTTLLVVRGALVNWCLLFLLVASCFGNDFVNFQLGPAPMTLDRLVFLVLTAVYAIHRRTGQTDPKPTTAVDRWGLLLVLWLGVTAVWGVVREGDAMLHETQWRFLSGYLMPAAVFWFARQSRITQRSVTGLHAALTVFGVYLAVTGLCEVLRLWPLVFPRYIADPSKGLHFGRARGPYVHSVSLGLYLGVCLLAAWAWLPQLRRGGQLLVLAAMPVLLLTSFLTYTRSVWLGVALGGVTVAGLALRGAWRPLLCGTAVLGGLIVGLTQMDRILYIKREHSATEAAGSVDMRSTFAYVSWQMFQDRPLTGFGFGQFPHAKLPYLDDRTTELRLEVIRPFVHHNTFLSLLTETGAIGLAAFLTLLALCCRDAWRLWTGGAGVPLFARRHGLLLLGATGVYALQLLFHELTYSTVHNSLYFLLAGVTVGLRIHYVPLPQGASLSAHAWRLLWSLRRMSPQWPAAGA